MRILALLTDGFGGRGGIAKFNRDLLTAFATHSDCAEIVALPRIMAEPPGPMPNGVSWSEEGLGGKFRFARALLRLVRSADARARWGCQRGPLTESGFDLILCGHINLLPLAVLARWVLGRRRVGRWTGGAAGPGLRPQPRRPRASIRPPIVLIVHGVEAWQPTCGRWSDFLLGKIDGVVAVSELTRARFCGWALLEGKPSFVLPNCTDLNVFKPGPKNGELARRYQLGRPVLMTLGRLSSAERYKGIDEVLELMPALLVELPELTYLVVGGGDDCPRLEAKARSLGLTVSGAAAGRRQPANAVFTGYVPEREKAELYRLADAFVMPGRGEGFGIVYLEALACGVPVVASKADASREVLRDCPSAFLADPGNSDDIWNAICRALAAPRGAVPDRVRWFSHTNFTERALKLLDDLKALRADPGALSKPVETRKVFGLPQNAGRAQGPLRAAGA